MSASVSTTTTLPMPPPEAVAVAPDLPDILPPVKTRRGVAGFVWRHPTIAIGLAILAVMLFIAVFAPLLGTADPTALAPAKRTREPSLEYWFGTDAYGRDIYSRVLYGARVSLLVGFSVAVLASLVGPGNRPGLRAIVRALDGIVMRVMDGMMSIPPILLAIALMALTRASVQNVIMAITIAEIPRVPVSCAASCCRCASSPMSMRRSRPARARRMHHPAPHPAQHAGAPDGAGDLHLRLAP